MKKLLTVSLIMLTLALVGCDLANLGDPNSAESRSAREALTAAENTAPLVPSPAKELLLGTVAALGTILTAIQTKRKKVSDTAKTRAEVTTEQIVRGIDTAIKDGVIVASQSFSDAMNAAQDSTTRDVVDKIQGKS